MNDSVKPVTPGKPDDNTIELPINELGISKPFHNTKPVERARLSRAYVDTNFFSRWFYLYPLATISAVRANEGKFKDEDVQDMNLSGTSKETDARVKWIHSYIANAEE